MSSLINGGSPSINFGFGSLNLEDGSVRTLFSKGNTANDYLDFGLGALGNFSDAMKVINPQDDPGTLGTQKGIPGHSFWDKKIEIEKNTHNLSYGPSGSSTNFFQKIFGCTSTAKYHESSEIPGVEVPMNSGVMVGLHNATEGGFYCAALGLHCSGATTLAALLSGHFTPNIGLLPLNLPAVTYFSLRFEAQMKLATVLTTTHK